MIRRRDVINLSFFAVLVAIMLVFFVRSIVSVDQVERPYRLQAEFTNAVGVLPNAEVTYLGVNYGTVTSVRRIPGGVRIGMNIRRGRHIPAGSTAHILRKSALGEQYVDFEPPDGSAATKRFYAAGTVVHRDHTTVPLEFSALLRSASNLLAAIAPDDVRTLLHEGAIGLNGRTDSLHQLAEGGDRLSKTLADRSAALDRLATNQTRLTKVVADHRGALGQSLTDLHQVASSLRDARGDLEILLDTGAPFLTATADLVAGHKGNLDCDLKILERVLDETNTPRRLVELRALLEIGPRAFGGVWDSRDLEADGAWIRVGFVGNPNNPPKQYVPPQKVPPSPPVPACTSALQPRASGVDYRPGQKSRALGAMLPATGADSGIVLGMALLATFLALRSGSRAQP